MNITWTRNLIAIVIALLAWSGVPTSHAHAQYGSQDEGFAGIDDPRQADLERPSNAQDTEELEQDDARERSLEQEDRGERQIQSPSMRQDDLEQGDPRQYELEH